MVAELRKLDKLIPEPGDFTTAFEVNPDFDPVNNPDVAKLHMLDGASKRIATEQAYTLTELNQKITVLSDEGEEIEKYPWNEWVEYEGQKMRMYTAVVCRLVRKIHEGNLDEAAKRKVLMAFGGLTSGGLFDALEMLEALEEKNGVEIFGVLMPLIQSADSLAKIEPEVELIEGKPSHITVPGATSIDAVNRFLKENHPGYEVYFDITTATSSTIAGNFFTGGLGDNRLCIGVDGVMMVSPYGKARWVTDPVEINALRATQGYTCIGTEFRLAIRKVPTREEQVIVNLDGDTHRKTLTKSLPRLIAALYPYLRERDDDGVWVDGIEFLDSTGMSTIIRVKGQTEDELAEEVLREMGSKSVTSIMLRVRHSEDEVLENCDSEKAKKFVDTLSYLISPQISQAKALFEILNGMVEENVGNDVNLDCDSDLDEFLFSVYSEPSVGHNREPYLHLDGLDELGFLQFVQDNVEELRKGCFRSTEDKAQFETIVAQLLGSQGNELGVPSPYLEEGEHCLRSIRFVTDPHKIEQYKLLRERVPEHRRLEAKRTASGSNDRDVVFVIEKIDGREPTPEEIRQGVLEAVAEIMLVTVDIHEEVSAASKYIVVNEEGVEVARYNGMQNGHLDFIPSVFAQAVSLVRDSSEGLNVFNGGGNSHYAINETYFDKSPTAKRGVAGILRRLSSRTSDLHGRRFGSCIRMDVRYGEKNYPALKPKWEDEFVHFVEAHRSDAVSLVSMMYVFGINTIFNFRAPDYKEILFRRGLGEVWQEVIQQTSVFRSSFGLFIDDELNGIQKSTPVVSREGDVSRGFLTPKIGGASIQPPAK